ncbi:hypothetical protein [Arthrobacter koreensis]|uniref:hypothetical protein n=1 Tax=Arthrobacter koreensis TaxID=199136 RepID=UPI002DB90C61|nr:hypothetical protein [Arthrobacter koreensis]MEB7447283.1 hypothetical protein [Arthrobacter koreensis]
MSSQRDVEKSSVSFGDRLREDDFAVEPAYGRAFVLPSDDEWLTRLCLPLMVGVRR